MEEPKPAQGPAAQDPNPNSAPPCQAPATATATAAAGSLAPPKIKKRPHDSNTQIQDCTFFKMRAVLKDIRPHLLEVLRAGDFRCCKGADELRERLKLLIELYKLMTAEAVVTKKPKNESGGQQSNGNGTEQKPEKQLHDAKLTDRPQSNDVFAKPPEKEAIDLEVQSSYIGGSAFGWNFITFPGSKPVFNGRTKEAFRAAQVVSEVS